MNKPMRENAYIAMEMEDEKLAKNDLKGLVIDRKYYLQKVRKKRRLNLRSGVIQSSSCSGKRSVVGPTFLFKPDLLSRCVGHRLFFICSKLL